MDFYLYRIFDGEQTLYIGKGSGSRLARQKRRFQVAGEIIARFADEDEAYAEERRLISLHKPPFNKHPGGMGGRYGAQTRKELPSGLTPEGLPIAAPYVARLLVTWSRDQSLVGILSVLGAYIKAHGLDAIEQAVLPYMKRLLGKGLALEIKP